MKTISAITRRGSIVISLFIVMIFITNPLFSQDSSKKDQSKKQMKVVVKTDKNGHTRVLDTTFNLSGNLDDASLKKIMKEYSIDLEGLTDDMQEMVVQIDDDGIADSGKVDSLCKTVKKIRIIGTDGKGRGNSHAYQYMYDFNQPDMPPPPPPAGNYFFDNYSGMEPFSGCCGEKGNTLSDILGDIPMERVKSYSIKETKNGKKIVIELNNAPLFECHDKVVIIREPRHRSSSDRSGRPRMEKKIIMSSDGE